MRSFALFGLLALASVLSGPARAQGLVDQGFVAGWNVMVDPAMGNGCLIQTVYADLSVVRIGYDAAHDRGYFVVFNKAWGAIETGKTYDITFDLDGQKYPAEATGFRMDRVPGAGVFFDDAEFIHAIARHRGLTVYNAAGERVMAIDLSGSAKALDYARQCQRKQG